MARDYFIGWSLNDKRNMLRSIQESMLTGNAVRLQTLPGVFSEFDPKTNHPDQLLERLEYSIANDANFDATNPIDAACKANGRPGITRPNFL